MSWVDQSAAFGANTLLTSAQLQALRDNRVAWTFGQSGSPLLQLSAIDTYALTETKCDTGIRHQLVDSGDAHNHDNNQLDWSGISTYAINKNRMSYGMNDVGSQYVGAGGTFYPSSGFFHFAANNLFSNSNVFQILVGSTWEGFSNVTAGVGTWQKNFGFLAWCDGYNMRWSSYDTPFYVRYQRLL